MSIAYSLQNLLLDDPELDHESLLGPVVRMRWMSNLLRLAVLEEADRVRSVAGEYTEHDAEIRRLRRSSMAPDAGRYYPVEGKANRIFKRLLPEQAPQIIEHWRSRQPILSRDYLEHGNETDVECDLPDEYSEVEYRDEEQGYDESPFSDEPEGNDRREVSPLQISSIASEPRSQGRPSHHPLIPSRANHQTPSQTPNWSRLEPLNKKRQAQSAKPKTIVTLAALAAILLAAATWFFNPRGNQRAARGDFTPSPAPLCLAVPPPIPRELEGSLPWTRPDHRLP